MALVALDDAVAHVMGRLPAPRRAVVAVRHAAGLVLAEDVVATEAVPPFDNSAVDGFAVRADDVAAAPVELAVSATLAAGTAPTDALKAGTAVRIMTGAPMPDGADAVVMVERSEPVGETQRSVPGADRVRIMQSVTPGAAVRRAGEDLAAGALALAADTVLGPAHVGVLATVGLAEVEVWRRVRVGVMSTGDELVGPGEPLQPGQIRDSNRVMLLALCDAAGFEAVDLGLVGDDESEVEQRLRAAAADCDAVITSGGVSMGDFDVVKAVLARVADMRWMQVAIKPAKPFAFGSVDPGGDPPVPVFGLAGNPVSSLVGFELFARPALRAMAGHRRPFRRLLPGIAAVPLQRVPDAKTHFVRVCWDGERGELAVRPAGAQGSHQLAASAGADALAVLPDGPGVPAGAAVDLMPLG